MPDILAIIPFYKRQDQLDKCLAALSASTHAIEPYIHDNSTDNVGFTKACNLGMREAMRRGHKYAILLNQDCYVQPDAVAKAVEFMDAHPKCAIAGPKQLRAEDPDIIVHGGCAQAFPTGQHFTGRVSQGQCAVSLPMPWVNGACMIVRVEALYDIGLMDEGYFLIASDSDFCFTARQRGYEVWYCAESVVLHEGGGVSSKQQSFEAMAHFNTDQRHFRDKWIGSAGWELLKEVPPQRKLTPQEIGNALQQAAGLLNKGQATQGELVLRHLLAYEPDHPDALLILGQIYLRGGLAALGAKELKKVIARVPDSANAHATLADCLLTCGLAADALVSYRRANELGIKSADLFVNMGLAMFHSGDKDGAIAQWRSVLSTLPSNAPLFGNVRKLLADAGVTDLPPAPVGAGAPPQAAAQPGAFRMP